MVSASSKQQPTTTPTTIKTCESTPFSKNGSRFRYRFLASCGSERISMYILGHFGSSIYLSAVYFKKCIYMERTKQERPISELASRLNRKRYQPSAAPPRTDGRDLLLGSDVEDFAHGPIPPMGPPPEYLRWKPNKHGSYTVPAASLPQITSAIVIHDSSDEEETPKRFRTSRGSTEIVRQSMPYVMPDFVADLHVELCQLHYFLQWKLPAGVAIRPLEELVSSCSEMNFPDIIDRSPLHWLRVYLDAELEIQPRLLGLGQSLVKDGPFYHGCHGNYMLNIMRTRNLAHGTIKTSGRAGLWHGPMKTAAYYAWPTVWPRCTAPTMAVLELRVTQHTQHKKNIAWVSRLPNSYEVAAILIARYTGDMNPRCLSKKFINTRNGAELIS